jgi:hypothetical protein
VSNWFPHAEPDQGGGNRYQNYTESFLPFESVLVANVVVTFLAVRHGNGWSGGFSKDTGRRQTLFYSYVWHAFPQSTRLHFK